MYRHHVRITDGNVGTSQDSDKKMVTFTILKVVRRVFEHNKEIHTKF